MKQYYLLPVILILFALPHNSFGTEQKTIFLLNSYHQAYPWTRNCLSGFSEAIGQEYKQIIFDMDTKRISPAQFREKANSALEMIRNITPDVVVVMDDNALKYCGQAIYDLGIPIVFMGINQNPRYYFTKNKLPDNVTGILERPLAHRSMVVIGKMLGPGNFLLMMDSGVTSKAIIHTSLNDQRKIHHNSNFMDVFTTGNYEEWKRQVKRLKDSPYKAVIISNYAAMRDSSGQQVPMNEVSIWTSTHSPIPVFAFWKYSVGKGKAVGGMVLSGKSQGNDAAQLTNIILREARIPTVMVPQQGNVIFSRHELSRWGLSVPKELEARTTYTD